MEGVSGIKKDDTQKIKNSEELSKLIEGRDVFLTKDILNKIIQNTKENNLKEVSSLLLSNEKLINNSTILRGDTFNGQGIGQAILRGSIEELLVQVVVIKGYKDEHPFMPLENDGDNYNRTVVHELLHSFTRYVVTTYNMNKEELLNDIEKKFYKNVSDLHKKFLENNSTKDKYLDSLDEYIVKSLTSNLSYNGQFDLKEYNSVFNEFKDFYTQNKREIKSISLRLSDSHI